MTEISHAPLGGGAPRLDDSKVRPEVWVPLFLVVLTLLVYGQVYNFQFCSLDDNLYITSNTTILGGLNRESVRYALTSWDDGSYLPLVWLSHAACISLFGLNAGGHHLVNLAFHIANMLLLFHLFRTLTKSFWPSAIVALLFSLHPLHVESVAWIAERKDVLSTFFWLLTTLAYVGYVRRPSLPRLVRMLGLFILGLLSKSMLVTLPVTLVLFDIWPLNRIDLSTDSWGKIATKVFGSVLEKWHLFALSIGCGLMTIIASRHIGALAIQGKGSYPLSIRLGNSAVAMAKYVQLTIAPVHLSPYYPHPGFGLSGWKVALSGALLILITWFCLREARRRPFLIVGWLWYVLTLLPVIGILQVGMQAYADRYTYVPLTGLFVMGVWLAWEAWEKWEYPRLVMLTLPAVLVGALVSVSAVQVNLWRDSFTLFTYALNLDANNGMAQLMLGDILRREGRYEEALEFYRNCNRNMPGVYRVPLKIGLVLNQLGRNEEAIAAFQHAHAMSPDHPLADQMLGSLLLSLGRFEEAEAPILRVLRNGEAGPRAGREIDPAVLQASRIDWGILLRTRHRLTDSVEALEYTLSLDPGFWRTRVELALSLTGLGRTQEALSHLQIAQASHPDKPEVLDALCTVYFHAGMAKEAWQAYDKLAQMDPKAAAAASKRLSLPQVGKPSVSGNSQKGVSAESLK